MNINYWFLSLRKNNCADIVHAFKAFALREDGILVHPRIEVSRLLSVLGSKLAANANKRCFESGPQMSHKSWILVRLFSRQLIPRMVPVLQQCQPAAWAPPAKQGSMRTSQRWEFCTYCSGASAPIQSCGCHDNCEEGKRCGKSCSVTKH